MLKGKQKTVFSFKIGLVVLILASLLVFRVQQAQAYVYHGCKWWPSTSINYDKSSLSTSWRTAVWNGAVQWNNVTPSPFKWNATDSSINDVFLGSIDGANNTLAVTTWSCALGVMAWMDIKFDTAESWYTGTGTPSTSQFDAWSVAAHEFGHGLGLGHTNVSCSGSESSRPTMCPSYSKGKTYFRSLHSDDKNGLNYIYP